MSVNLQESTIITLVKNKLNSERIKLWLPPYSDEEGNRAEFTGELVKRFAEELHLSDTESEKAIEDLRIMSVERLASRNRYTLTGVAALKIKVTAQIRKQNVSKESFTIDTKLEVQGAELRSLIANQCSIEPNKVKLIAGGRLIKDDATLNEQGISVTSTVMAIILPISFDTVNDSASCSVKKTREDAEILANQTVNSQDDGMDLMQIADQNGRVITIPKNERKALSLAMILNEKGKAALRRKDYSEAVLLLLEADKEFKSCSAEILKSVDNYALLCLDITWCYLCLKSIEDLPDAEARLKTCEECLNRSYGANLERLQEVKGTTGHESALFVRLNLLKGITSFFRRQWKVAEKLFTAVDNELKQLKVDDEKLSQVMAIGYSAAEARLGLRRSNGNVEMAVNYILNRRKEKNDNYEKEKKERAKRKEARKLGKTTDGEWLNLEFYQAIVAMGFPSDAAAAALRQSNNSISLAIQIIQDHPDLLTPIDAITCCAEIPISDEMVVQVASCGFDSEIARKCLKKHNANVQAALDDLISTGGIFLEIMDTESSPSRNSNDAGPDIKSENLQMQFGALERLRMDIPNDEDAHLDISLEEESEILREYQLMLSFVQR